MFRIRRIPAVAPLALLVALAVAPSARAAPEEVRAIWVTRWDFRTEADVRRAVRTAAELRLNRVFLQVRGRADAFYRSRFEPWGEEIGGRDPGFDPLAVAIDEGRKRHVEIDAWVNVLPGWKGGKPPRSKSHLWHRHPEWFLTTQRGERLRLDSARYTIVNPCLPEVRQYLKKVIVDIAERYPVSGVHLDYVRFVARAPEKGRDFPYDARSLALFKGFARGTPAKQPAKWDEWRRRCVNTVVRDLAVACREAKPGLRISVAAIADYDRAREGLFQDVATWQRRGWADEVFPMTYQRREPEFRRYVHAAIEVGPPGRVMPGIGVYMLPDAGTVASQIRLARALGSGGYALFALSDFQTTTSHESRAGTEAERRRRRMRATVRALNSAPAPRSIGK